MIYLFILVCFSIFEILQELKSCTSRRSNWHRGMHTSIVSTGCFWPRSWATLCEPSRSGTSSPSAHYDVVACNHMKKTNREGNKIFKNIYYNINQNSNLFFVLCCSSNRNNNNNKGETKDLFFLSPRTSALVLISFYIMPERKIATVYVREKRKI